MRKALLFICLLVAGPLLLLAQPRLAVDSISNDLVNDTLDYNFGLGDSIIEWTVRVVNNGNASYNGTVSVRCFYNNDTSTFWEKDEFVANNFEVGQSQVIIFNDTVRTGDARYKGGNNILVIWPHSDAPSVQAPDSSEAEVWIKQLVSVRDPQVFFARLKIGPNPVQGTLYLNYTKEQHKLEYVRVYNSAGQVLRTYDNAVDRIEFSELPAGLYFLDVHYRDGVGGSYKILVPR